MVRKKHPDSRQFALLDIDWCFSSSWCRPFDLNLHHDAMFPPQRSPDTLDVACRLQVVDAGPVRSDGEPRCEERLSACAGAGLPIVKSPRNVSRHRSLGLISWSKTLSHRLSPPVSYRPVGLPPMILSLSSLINPQPSLG